MPGKPSRRDRRRRGTTDERRPRPAPPISPGRIVSMARSDGPTVAPRGTDPHPEETRRESPAAVAPVVQSGSRARMSGGGALRRGVTTSARALEAQREERIRRDSIKDLRAIAFAAVITLAALIGAALLL